MDHLLLDMLPEHFQQNPVASAISRASEQSNSQKGRQLCHLLVLPIAQIKNQSAAALAQKLGKL
jgi:hypothetical protein